MTAMNTTASATPAAGQQEHAGGWRGRPSPSRGRSIGVMLSRLSSMTAWAADFTARGDAVDGRVGRRAAPPAAGPAPAAWRTTAGTRRRPVPGPVRPRHRAQTVRQVRSSPGSVMLWFSSARFFSNCSSGCAARRGPRTIPPRLARRRPRLPPGRRRQPVQRVDHVLPVLDAAPVLVEELAPAPRGAGSKTAIPSPLTSSRIISRPPKPRASFCRSRTCDSSAIERSQCQATSRKWSTACRRGVVRCKRRRRAGGRRRLCRACWPYSARSSAKLRLSEANDADLSQAGHERCQHF